jgi:hypothetical protein
MSVGKSQSLTSDPTSIIILESSLDILFTDFLNSKAAKSHTLIFHAFVVIIKFEISSGFKLFSNSLNETITSLSSNQLFIEPDLIQLV